MVWSDEEGKAERVTAIVDPFTLIFHFIQSDSRVERSHRGIQAPVSVSSWGPPNPTARPEQV